MYIMNDPIYVEITTDEIENKPLEVNAEISQNPIETTDNNESEIKEDMIPTQLSEPCLATEVSEKDKYNDDMKIIFNAFSTVAAGTILLFYILLNTKI